MEVYGLSSFCLVFGYCSKAMEVKDGWRKLRNEKLNDISTSLTAV